MTTAQRLFNEGREEGIEKGREEGEWIGKVLLLEKMLGAEPIPREVLWKLDISELQQKYEVLEREYTIRLAQPSRGRQ